MLLEGQPSHFDPGIQCRGHLIGGGHTPRHHAHTYSHPSPSTSTLTLPPLPNLCQFEGLPCYFRNTTRDALNWAYRSRAFRRQVCQSIHTCDTHAALLQPTCSHVVVTYPHVPPRNQCTAACCPCSGPPTLMCMLCLHVSASYTGLTSFGLTQDPSCTPVHSRVPMLAACLDPPYLTQQCFSSTYCVPGPLLDAVTHWGPCRPRPGLE